MALLIYPVQVQGADDELVAAMKEREPDYYF